VRVQRTVIILAVLLGLAVVTIAFMAGRMSSPAGEVIVERASPTTERTPDRVEAAREIRTEAQRELAAEQPAEPVRPPEHALQPIRPIQPIEPSQSQRAVEAVRGAESSPEVIETYFEQIKSVQTAGAGDPNALAQEIMMGATKGDTSGFDKLLGTIDEAQKKAAAITPPAACAHYHQTLLQSLQDGREVIQEMRTAIATGNINALAAVAGKAQSMQSRADELQQIEKSLRRN
jgi:hypothetical protein